MLVFSKTHSHRLLMSPTLYYYSTQAQGNSNSSTFQKLWAKGKEQFYTLKQQSVLFWQQSKHYFVLRREISNRKFYPHPNYREHLFLKRVRNDFSRIVPFLIISALPGGSILLPLVIYFYPNILPTPFQSESFRKNKIQQDFVMRFVSSKFLYQTIFSNFVTRFSHRSISIHDETLHRQLKPILIQFEQNNTSQPITNISEYLQANLQIMQNLFRIFSKETSNFESKCFRETFYFYDDPNLCKFVLLYLPWKFSGRVAQMRIFMHVLKKEDELLKDFGIENLSLEEIWQYLHKRGFTIPFSVEFMQTISDDETKKEVFIQSLQLAKTVLQFYLDLVHPCPHISKTFIPFLPCIMTNANCHKDFIKEGKQHQMLGERRDLQKKA